MRGIAKTSADTVHDHHTDHHLGQRLVLDRRDTVTGLIGRGTRTERGARHVHGSLVTDGEVPPADPDHAGARRVPLTLV
ncbi:hypothetical protein GFH48_03245 [Streptomyces fagopyri]|uniref:Uncharacterized protein n=1 Tax=Streptomyces fagopyri TaxID=2662397 RepID=A0A5Q0L5S4_9ACTN|nr:hypothetical protein [Streptomyces fagopyri]QFZ72405.1 hypothetical protein GFH48_03245 [Streptomyces fagopyri]